MLQAGVVVACRGMGPNASAGRCWRQMNDGEDNGYMMEQEQAFLTGTSAADEDEDDDALVAAAKTEPDAYLQNITFVAGGKSRDMAGRCLLLQGDGLGLCAVDSGGGSRSGRCRR